jgi:hypothetical protein
MKRGIQQRKCKEELFRLRVARVQCLDSFVIPVTMGMQIDFIG